MPKFAKGSPEAKEYMKNLRAKRGKGLVRNAIDDIEKLGTTIKDQSLAKTMSDAQKMYAANKADVAGLVSTAKKAVSGRGSTKQDFEDIGKNIKAGFQRMGGRIHNRKVRPAQGSGIADSAITGLMNNPDMVASLAKKMMGQGMPKTTINNQYVPPPPSRLPSVPQGEISLGVGGRSGLGGMGMCPTCGEGLEGFGLYAGAPVEGGRARPNLDKYGEPKMCAFKASLCGAQPTRAGRPKGAKNKPKGGKIDIGKVASTAAQFLPLLALL